MNRPGLSSILHPPTLEAGTNVSHPCYDEIIGGFPMQEAIDRVMVTYGMIAELSPEAERNLRQAVTSYLATSPETDSDKLAIEGLKFARETAGQG
jgi:hypothetical protein